MTDRADPQGDAELIARLRVRAWKTRLKVDQEHFALAADRLEALSTSPIAPHADGETGYEYPQRGPSDAVPKPPIERIGPDAFYGAVGVALFKADLGGLRIDQKINFVGNAAYTALAAQEGQEPSEALCKRVFLAGHSEGWTGNQQRRDVQYIDAEKGWNLYVKNGALEAAMRSAASQGSGES